MKDKINLMKIIFKKSLKKERKKAHVRLATGQNGGNKIVGNQPNRI